MCDAVLHFDPLAVDIRILRESIALMQVDVLRVLYTHMHGILADLHILTVVRGLVASPEAGCFSHRNHLHQYYGLEKAGA